MEFSYFLWRNTKEKFGQKITDEEFKQFTSNYDLLTQFVNECKQRKNDNRLLEKPGKWRGDPC